MADEIKFSYQFGDISRGFLNLFTGWDVTRDEAAYKPGDLTRGMLAAITGDESWKRTKGAYTFGNFTASIFGTSSKEKDESGRST